VLAADPALVELAGDKQATILALAAGGLPVPSGTVRAAGEAWPVGFHRPAVRKARDGVGCEGFAVLPPGAPPPGPASRAERIEAFIPGEPIGVSCLCGPGRVLPLPALVQRFGRDAQGDPAYVGGSPLTDPWLQGRARALAIRAIRALERAAGPDSARGWLGVDMILGFRADGRDDRVLEVNPRVTSSFVSHAAGATSSLVRLMLAIVTGHPLPPVAFASRDFRVTDS
jgi:predicted ATP-grasp superfamily ATP-dependent carboligase